MGIIVEPLPSSEKVFFKQQWRLHSPIDLKDLDLPIDQIREGFITDFATSPRLLWFIMPPYGRWNKAAIVHDYLYKSDHMDHVRSRTVTRKEVDQIFFDIMTELEVSQWRRYPMYWAVRVFGWIPWRKYRRK